MAYQKVIQIGNAGALTISESAGVATVQVSVAESVGGGQTAGVVSAKLSAEVDVSAKQLIDVGLELAAAKFPSAAALIVAAQAAIDAEIAKL